MYLPKSKYKKKNTTGGQFQEIDTGNIYVGSYIETMNGKFFTGSKPSSKSVQLIPIVEEGVEAVGGSVVPPPVVEVYDVARNNNVEFNLKNTAPVRPHYPKPSSSDYTKGIIKRYFAVDKTTGQILEVSPKVYASMKAQKPEYYYPKYELKTLKWSLRDRSVNRINSSVTKLDSYLKDPSQFVR